jgi:DNA-binding beta-propeller fold protein YncE
MFCLNALRIIRPCAFLPFFLLGLLLFSLAGLSGCLSLKTIGGSDSGCEVPGEHGVASRISFFLSVTRIAAPHLKLQLVSVEILRDGLWIPISSEARALDTETIGSWQVLLGQNAFLPGNYEKVKLTFGTEAILTSRDASSVLILPETVVELPFPSPFNLPSPASESFFIDWDVDASFAGPALGPLAFSLNPARPSPITANQIYVACPDINTVYSVSTDKKWVDGSFFVAGRPTYIAIDDLRQKLFVLCQDDGDIKIFDLVTNSLVDVIGLPMTFRPKFMWVNGDLTKAYVIDDLGNLSVVDLQTGSVAVRGKIGQQPGYVIHIPETQTIAVSSRMDSTVYLLDDQTLAVKDRIIVGSSPAGILQKDDFLYIAEELADRVTVFDFKLRRKVDSLAVGYSPSRLVGLDSKIYVANGGSLSLVRTQNNKVAREIPVAGHLFEMVVSEKEQLLYVGKKVEGECGGSLGILDITSSKIIGEIEIGSWPRGIVIGH